METTQSAPTSVSMWIPLFSLLLGGIPIHIGGKQPDILYFDLVFAIWLVYQVLWNGFFPSFSNWIVRIGVLCVLCDLFSTLVNNKDMLRGIAATKVFAVGILVYAVAKNAPLGLLTVSLFGACSSIFLLRDYQDIRFGDYSSLSGLKDDVEIAMGRSNTVASVLILLIPLAVAGACLQKGKKRWIFLACAMLMCAGILVTMSRGGMLALAGASFLSLPFLRRAGLKLKHGVAALVMLGVILVLVPIGLLETNVALFAYRLENPDYAREEILRAAWGAFLKNPVLGVGPGQLGDAINHEMIVPTSAGDRYYNAHNLVIDSLAEMGLPAGLALLMLVAGVMRAAWIAARTHTDPLSVAIWVALLAALIHNMVEASFEGQQFQVVFWAVAAMAGRRWDGGTIGPANHAQV